MSERNVTPQVKREAASSAPASLPPVAFVTPWYGAKIPGGAEAQARETADRLQRSGVDVEIWTTTLGHLYTDWSKAEHKPGLYHVQGIPVRRFDIAERDKATFDAINWRLMHGLPIPPEEEQVFISEMFRAPDLYEHIRRHGKDRLLFFIGYMYPTTYFGAQIYPRRSAIIPCLHDETYAQLTILQEVLRASGALVFNTRPEQELARRLLGRAPHQIWKVIGMGLEQDVDGNAERFRKKYRVRGPFVLNVGRREPGKNTPLLLQYWQRYVHEHRNDVKLVLIGPGDVQVPPAAPPYVHDLRYVPVQDKLDAYAAASLLCQPSVNESFSIVLLESWRAGTPVLVNGHCDVTVDHCRRSNGGLYFLSYEEFAATLTFMLEHPELSETMGRQGQRYVSRNFRWPAIDAKYLDLIGQMQRRLEAGSPAPAKNE